MQPAKVAVIGPGSVGIDLMMKVLRTAPGLEMSAMVGIDPASPGLTQAADIGIPTSARGLAGLVAMPHFRDIALVFDATTAGAHRANAVALEEYGKRVVHLTHASIGARVVPDVNLDDHVGAGNINVLTGTAQATVPLVAAISRVTPVLDAAVAAFVAGATTPVTRDRLASLAEITSGALTALGGAGRGRATLSMDHQHPPRPARATVRAAVAGLDRRSRGAVCAAVREAAERITRWSPGFRLADEVRVERRDGARTRTDEITIGLEMAGAGAHLPVHAGNLDLMTATAVHIAERVTAER